MTNAAALLACHVPGHRQGLQIHFRTRDGRAHVEEHATFQLSDGLCEDEKVRVRRGAECRAITVWVLVNDVATNPHVASDRYSIAPAGAANTPGAVRKPLLFDYAPYGLAQSLAATSRLTYDFVDPAGISPHTEFTLPNVMSYVLACSTLISQFKVMDDTGPVRRQKGNPATFHEVDEETGQTLFNDMRADHPNDRSLCLSCLDNSPDEVGELGVFKRSHLRIERKTAGKC